MLGIYDISETEKQFVISRMIGTKILESDVYQNLVSKNPELAERFFSSIVESIKLLGPDDIEIVSDPDKTLSEITAALVRQGKFIKLNDRFPNSYLYRGDPNDVARSEKDTYICTSANISNVGPTNNWMNSDAAKGKLFPLLLDSYRGRKMYAVPYWLGPYGSEYGQAGIEVTDSLYVVANLIIITKAGLRASTEMARSGSFVFGIHSMKNLDPKNKYICHFPEENEGDGLIISVNSNYGGNALLSKKCHALRIASARARKEGWLAEHMMLIGLRAPSGEETFVSAAFPSASSKTNLSMLDPPDPLRKAGWTTSTVSDDIIWIHNRDGKMHAVNPESGFFGVAPHTNMETNPNAMLTISKNTIFTNVGLTKDGQPFWEGLSEIPDGVIDWSGKEHRGTSPVAHPNSRFTTPIREYPHLSKLYNDPMGAPISAIFYGGRRASLIPLVYETFSWAHGVLVGAMQRVETTAAAEHKVGTLRNDPMAIRPFLAYNMAEYFAHHLDFGSELENPPKVFNVNWFRKGNDCKFIWPGYRYNMYVMLWAIDRVKNRTNKFEKTPIGYIPTSDYFAEYGLEIKNIDDVLSVDASGYLRELEEVKPFLESFGDKMPDTLWKEFYDLRARLENSLR